jgi:DnaJ-class molecular chaperone
MSARDDPDPERLYERLALAPNASQAEINAAYRRLVLALHPDSAPHAADSDALQQVIAAHRILSDPQQRRAYDGRHRDAGVREAPPPRRDCAVCRGTGSVELACPQCAGTGEQRINAPWLQTALTCAACAGRKTRRTRCGACAGSGTQ